MHTDEKQTRQPEENDSGTSPIPVVKGRRRNLLCSCGSNKKYKLCCLERDQQRYREAAREEGLPGWILDSRRKLHQFEKYACKVYELPRLLGRLRDGRRDPDISTFDVMNCLFHAAVLRTPSINAIEGNLKEPDFQRLIGRRPTPERKAFSADVIADVLDVVDVQQVEGTIPDVIFQLDSAKFSARGLRRQLSSGLGDLQGQCDPFIS